jgi:hypothetical protein
MCKALDSIPNTGHKKRHVKKKNIHTRSIKRTSANTIGVKKKTR